MVRRCDCDACRAFATATFEQAELFEPPPPRRRLTTAPAPEPATADGSGPEQLALL